ncbi:MAG: 6-phosphofructokinase, partial [Bacteroidetes bacterium]
GSFGRMVALQENHVTSVPLEAVAGKTRCVPLEAPMVAAALAVGTSFGVRALPVHFSGTEETPAIS